MLNKQHGKKNVIHSILGKLAQTFKQEAVGEATHMVQTHVPSTSETIDAMASASAPSLSRLIYMSQPSD
jgi:hypothetical protein